MPKSIIILDSNDDRINQNIIVEDNYIDEINPNDTSSFIYTILGFIFPFIGLIAMLIFKKMNYIKTYYSLKRGVIYGFGTIGIIVLIFVFSLILAII